MLYTHVAAAAVALAVGFGAGWQTQGWRQARIAADIQAQTATLREDAMHSALIETTRRLTAQQEAAHAAEIKARRARGDAAAARDSERSLREHADRLAADASACDPASAASSPASRLAAVLGESVAEYRAVAEAADRAVIAGSECAGRYDALTP